MACICCGNTATTKTEDGKQTICPNCGRFYPVNAQVNMIYGTNYNDRECGLDIALTEKYLMVHKVPGKKGAQAAFGVVGWMVTVGMDKMDTWAYYDKDDFREIIFPYRTKKLKDDWGIKFINKDGTDFILRGQFGTTMRQTADSLKAAGYPVVDGSKQFFGERYCDKPFLNSRTLGTHICPSAASFARMGKGCFVSASHGSGKKPAAVGAPVPPQPQPAEPKPAPAKPAEPVFRQPAPKVEKKPPVQAGGKFPLCCARCGASLTEAECEACGFDHKKATVIYLSHPKLSK